MSKSEAEFQLNDMLIFFPVHYANFTNHVFDLLDDPTPRVQMGIVFALKKYGSLPISQIGEKIAVARPNMTAIIDSMEGKGWIKRNQVSEDRRKTNVEITAAGLKYLEETTAKLNKILKERFSILSDVEYDKLMDCLEFLTNLSIKLIR